MMISSLIACRMFTSKLYVDPAHVAEAERNDFAKCVADFGTCAHSACSREYTSAFARRENHYLVNDVC